MLSQQVTQPPKEESTFDRVYQLAKKKNKNALNDMVKKGYCLGELHGTYTPARLLAEEGDIDSVDFLINKFNVNHDYAVLGYARSCRNEQVSRLLEQGADPYFAVWGYALGKHVDQVKLMTKDKKYLDAAIKGYAEGGHIDLVNELLAQGVKQEYAICGYAMSCLVPQVDDLLAKGASSDDAVFGYALGGHTAQVNELLGKGADPESAIPAYAMSGYTEQADDLNQKIKKLGETSDDSNDVIVLTSAVGGHVDHVTRLIEQGYSRNAAANGYALGEHIHLVNDQIKNGALSKPAYKGYKDICQQHVSINKKLRLMIFTNDPNLKQSLAKKMTDQDETLDIEDLQKRAVILQDIMKAYGLDVEQAQSLLSIMLNNHLLTLDETQLLTSKNAIDLLQIGMELVRNNSVSTHLFLHISSFVFGLPNPETAKILNTAAHVMFEVSKIKINERNRYQLFSSKEQYQEKLDQAEERLKARLNFYKSLS